MLNDKKEESMKKKIKVAIVTVVCALLFMAGYSFSSLAANDVVRIGNVEFAEQRILGQLFAIYLESKGYKTEVSELPSTWSIFNALKNGDIDVYTDYTGALYGVIFNRAKALSEDETYNYVKTRLEEEYGITLLKPLGWNNTYMLTVTPETAKKYRLKTISDLIPVANRMILGSDPEFPYRKDGLIGLSETYVGLNFRNTKSMPQALTYQALVDGKVDSIASYSTDGQIEQYGLVNLIDDRNFFPPYYVAPILKMDFAAKNPEVVAALEKLANQWTEDDMKKYNLMVDEGQDPRAVAELMLRDKGLI
jgi:glycine betaine/choline ABC-type transport system substrate-binding protein